jgi:PAS domain S-box-containing protein
MKAIIFEDELLVANDLKSILIARTTLKDITIVNDLEKFKSLLSTKYFDLALLDVNISNEPTGILAGRYLRENFKMGLVYLTAFTDDNTTDEIIKTNPDAYIIKPFNETQLIVTIKQVLLKYNSNSVLGNIHLWKNNEGLIKSKIEFFQETLDQLYLVSIADQAGRIIYVNNAFCKASGYSESELLGKNHNIVNSGHHSEEFFKNFWETIHKGEIWQGVVKNKKKNGEFYWVCSHVFALSSEDNLKTRYFISIRNDITEQIDLKEKIQNQFEEQVGLTRVISHDISNYLNVIQFSIANIANYFDENGGETHIIEYKNIERSLRAVERIKSLIKNIRELQSIDDEKIRLKLEPLNLGQTLDLCLEVFIEVLNKKSIQVEVDCPKHIEILAEKNSLSMSVINNIISNAIKFSKVNSIISITCKTKDNLVEFVCEDRGIGMDNELLKNIFSKNIKTTRPGTQNEMGTGFGMPLVKRYIEFYGGSIHIESRSDQHYPEESGTKVLVHFRSAPLCFESERYS